ncbi:MAG: DUF222 domain-containing protein [Deltaproteobacteria bacterium]|nr:DUF222 domain-containing protein [Deltaproteobacteria bacterium]
MLSGTQTDVKAGGAQPWMTSGEPWREVAAELKAIARAKAKLDARELWLLREAEECGVYRRLGFPTMQAYMIAELDCSRHTANEKLRVAYELIELPLIDTELRAGALSWTKVREITRVATAETEEAWLSAIEGKDSSRVQQMVKGHRKGALPSDRPDPALVDEWVGLNVTAPLAAVWRQMRTLLDDEAGKHLSDDEAAEEIAKRVLMPMPGPGEVPKPQTQVSISTCRGCKQAFRIAPGVELVLRVNDYELALCDSVFIGDLESDDVTPSRTRIPHATRRKVFTRDHFACTVPGCTSRRFLRLHHLRHCEYGGCNLASNLITLCDGHHRLLHEGVIAIRGTAPDALVFTLPLAAELETPAG